KESKPKRSRKSVESSVPVTLAARGSRAAVMGRRAAGGGWGVRSFAPDEAAATGVERGAALGRAGAVARGAVARAAGARAAGARAAGARAAGADRTGTSGPGGFPPEPEPPESGGRVRGTRPTTS